MLYTSLICLVLVFISQNISAEYPSVCPEIVSKSSWGGRAPKAIEYSIIPLKYVVVHHTVTPNCKDDVTCSDLITNIQNYHMDELDFHDIGYNFLVGGNGKIYEGAGWHKVGAHTRGYNTKSIGIGFVGNFIDELPTKKQIEAGKKFLECAVQIGELDSRYKLIGARTVSATQSPGLALFRELATWKGFTTRP